MCIRDSHITALGALHALFDGAQDGLRVLVTGIIAGENGEIRQSSHDLTHDGPLAMVAVAATAKEHNQQASRKGAHGGEHVFQRVGRMSVVQDHLIAVSYTHLDVYKRQRYACPRR